MAAGRNDVCAVPQHAGTSNAPMHFTVCPGFRGERPAKDALAKRPLEATWGECDLSRPPLNPAKGPPWSHGNYSVETGSDRSSDIHYAPMTWGEIEALGSLIPAAPDCMFMVWVSAARWWS